MEASLSTNLILRLIHEQELQREKKNPDLENFDPCGPELEHHIGEADRADVVGDDLGQPVPVGVGEGGAPVGEVEAVGESQGGVLGELGQGVAVKHGQDMPERLKNS